MELDLRVQHHDDRAVVHVSGEVDLATCPQLRDVLAELVDRGVHHLIVDLDQVTFLDSSGIGVLIGVLGRIREHGGSLRLTAPSPHVRRVLELTGITALLPTYATLDEAVPVEPLWPIDCGCRRQRRHRYDMTQEITGASATAGAALVSIISIANASGRSLWAWLSDFIGRKWVFLTMFAVRAVLFLLLPNASAYALFTLFAFIIITCYGGGFGTMPAFAADYLGPKNVSIIYGLMLTAWGTASAVGPLIVSALRTSSGSYSQPLSIIAVIMLVSLIVPFIVRPPRPQIEETKEVAPSPASS